MSPPVAVPKPGEVYLQFDFHLIVLEVDANQLTYCCRYGEYTGIARQVSLDNFRALLERGLIRKGQI